MSENPIFSSVSTSKGSCVRWYCCPGILSTLVIGHISCLIRENEILAVGISCASDSRYLLFTISLTDLVKARGSSPASVAKASIAEKPNHNFGLLFPLRLEVSTVALDFLELFDVHGGDDLFAMPCGFGSCMSTFCSYACMSCSCGWHGKH